MKESQSLLQRFFDASLIPSETTDERLNHYQAAAADIAKRFGESPCDAVSASRVAIDPNCPATDPWFNTVQEAVKVHWKTFLVKNHDAPRQICRAILLEALSKAAEQNPLAPLVIWNASSSLLPHLGNGPEQVITREFISGLGDKSEIHSSEGWCNGTTTVKSLPEFEIKLPAMKAAEVDEAKLLKGLAAASGPTNEQGQPLPNSNRYWSNSGGSWSYDFSPRATKAIAAAINNATTETKPAVEEFSKQLAPALKKHASALYKWVMGSVERNQRLTSLLWWRQTLYSPSLRCSYRELSPAGTAIAISFDLGNVSGAPVPLSVEYFLRETMRNVLPENPKLTLAELVAAIKSSDVVGPCLPTTPTGIPHRISLREFLSVVRQEVPPENTTSAYVGIVSSTSLPISEWAVWLLRERLAEILSDSET